MLAGTREARVLLERCADLSVEASLAGTTQTPDLPVPTRVGGFGGEAGFRASLPAYRAVIDATHPFAVDITARTARVCADCGTPYLRLTRAPWPVEAGWVLHRDLPSCAARINPTGRIFLAVGPGGLAPFLNRNLHLWCRRIDRAADREGVTWVIGRPGDESAESGLLRSLRITHLVAKNAGGAETGKLLAAKTLGIEVHMIERPASGLPGQETHSIDTALDFARSHATHNL